MPGILSGLVKGIEANRAAGVQQQSLDLQKQRLGLEQDQQQFNQAQVARENKRQDIQDRLAGTSQETKEIQDEGRAALQVTDKVKPGGEMAMPTEPRPDPVKDPAGAQLWDHKKQAHDDYVAGDEYKNAVQSGPDILKRFHEAGERHRAVLGEYAGHVTQGITDDMPRTEALLATNPELVTRAQLADYTSAKLHLPADVWVSKNGQPSQGQVWADQIRKAQQTGNWDGAQDAVTALVPPLQMALGAQHPNGNTVNGVQVTHAFHDADDPKIIHLSHAMVTDGPAGQQVLQSPHMADDGIKVHADYLKEQAAKFLQVADLMKNQQNHDKVSDAVANGETALQQLMRMGAAYGVPPLPKGDRFVVGPGQRAFREDPGGGPAKLIAQGADKPSLAQMRQNLLDLERDPSVSDEEKSAAEAEYRAAVDNTSKTTFYHGRPNDPDADPSSGGGGSAPIKPAEKKAAVDAATEALKDEYGYHKEKGQWIDNDSGEPVKKGDPFYARLNAINARQFTAKTADDLTKLDPGEAPDKSSAGPSIAGPTTFPDSGRPIPVGFTHGDKVYQGNGKWAKVAQGAQQAPVRPPHAPAAVATAAAPPQAPKDEQPPSDTGADQGAAIRKLAEPVNYADYVSSGPSGSKRGIDADIASASGALTQLQSSMGDTSLPESVRADMQHRFAAELMRRNELMEVKRKMAGG